MVVYMRDPSSNLGIPKETAVICVISKLYRAYNLMVK